VGVGGVREARGWVGGGWVVLVVWAVVIVAAWGLEVCRQHAPGVA
jgi:hypothetical protein